MAYGLSNGHVTYDVTWPRRCCEAVRSAILATAWLLVSNCLINSGCFPESTFFSAAAGMLQCHGPVVLLPLQSHGHSLVNRW